MQLAQRQQHCCLPRTTGAAAMHSTASLAKPLRRQQSGAGSSTAAAASTERASLHSLARTPRAKAKSAQPLTVCRAAVQASPAVEAAEELVSWVATNGGSGHLSKLRPESFAGRIGYVATEDFRENEVVLQISADLCVTKADVEKHEAVGPLAEGRSEIIGLALWLVAERAKGEQSEWRALLKTLPKSTLSPLLWPAEERSALLRGSPVLEEAESRAAAIDAEWDAISAAIDASPEGYPADTYTRDAFRRAVAVVLAAAAFLPTAQCFALVPLASGLRRTGNENGALLDYDGDTESVQLITQKPRRSGQEVMVLDGRPNGEMLLAAGSLEEVNTSDFLSLTVGLVGADKLYNPKKEILDSVGFTTPQEFPITAEGMPLQLLSYLRLARVQDPADFARISFEADAMVSPINEYEVLQVLMGDVRERLSAFEGNIEEDVKQLQNPDLSATERLAIRQRLSEKQILQGTMDAVRRFLWSWAQAFSAHSWDTYQEGLRGRQFRYQGDLRHGGVATSNTEAAARRLSGVGARR